MITPEMKAQIRRLFFAEHFRIGTISAQLQVHPDTVQRAIETDRFVSNGRHYKSRLDPYLRFIGETLTQYPTLRSTRVYEMLVSRGYAGSASQVRAVVSKMRPRQTEAFMRLTTMPGEQAQVDWAHFGHIVVGKAKRPLYAFVMVMSWSRAIHALFTLDQTTDSFLLGHVKAFEVFSGSPRVILYDNLKSAVLQRYGDVIQFNPRILELCAHYHFEPRPVAVARGNEKGRVERAIRFLRDRFFAARPFHDVDDLNAQFALWREAWAHTRPCQADRSISVGSALELERKVLIPLPEHPFDCDHLIALSSGKTPYLRFDLNNYSIPHHLVRKPLTLVASPETVRILDGSIEVARHKRSFDRGEFIEDEKHLAGLSEAKKEARSSRSLTRLSRMVGTSTAFLEESVLRGHRTETVALHLNRLLDDYGPMELNAAIGESVSRGTPTIPSVTHILERNRRKARILPQVGVVLPDNPKIKDLRVTPHNLETYDALAKNEPTAKS